MITSFLYLASYAHISFCSTIIFQYYDTQSDYKYSSLSLPSTFYSTLPYCSSPSLLCSLILQHVTPSYFFIARHIIPHLYPTHFLCDKSVNYYCFSKALHHITSLLYYVLINTVAGTRKLVDDTKGTYLLSAISRNIQPRQFNPYHNPRVDRLPPLNLWVMNN
jgi:hypothetical protein